MTSGAGTASAPKRSGTEWDLYSFAVKCCSFRSPRTLPIHGNPVGYFLVRVNRALAFVPDLRRSGLLKCGDFRHSLDRFVAFLGLWFDARKTVDQDLYVLARY